MKRREFLISSANSLSLLGLNSLFPLAPAQAEQLDAPWFFVQIYMKYGWDVTLSLDPWLKAAPSPTDLFLEYDPSNITRSGNVALGPALLPLKDFAQDLCVVNGIFMSANDSGHDAAEKYMRSGSTESQWGGLTVEIQACRAEKLLGVLNNQGVATGMHNPGLSNFETVKSLGTGSSFVSAQNAGNHLSEVQRQLEQAGTQIARLHSIYNSQPNPGDAQAIAAAFASGLAQIADYQLSESMDTHSNHAGQHLDLQKKDWEKVAELFRVFKQTPADDKGNSLYDRTTFMIVSEFSRTPALNKSLGKDHNPMTNSVALVGPKIRGNTVLGGSHLVTAPNSATGASYHIASPVDMATGQRLDHRTGATVLRPENIVATVVESLGISRRRFASVKPSVPSLGHLIRK